MGNSCQYIQSAYGIKAGNISPIQLGAGMF